MPEITVKGAKVTYSESGSESGGESGRGETVVLLHGSASSRTQWRALSAHLEKSFHVVAPDLYGYGGTDGWGGPGPLTLAEEAAIVSAMAARCPGPIHLVGHSYGGAVALRFALEQSRRLRSLLLIEPVAFHLLRDGDAVERELFRDVGALSASVAEAVLAADPQLGMARFVDFWSGEGTWARTREETRAALARRTAKVVQDFRATRDEWSPLAAYRRIGAPTLILCGETSHLSTQAIAGRLAAVLPRARLDRVQGAGHMMPFTHPGTVNAAVAAHLEQSAGAVPLAA